jgi:hypothetical protein
MSLRAALVVSGLALSALLVALPAQPSTTVTTDRSAQCHATDGTFTVCPSGGLEWSDVAPQFFSDTNSYLYADQADLDPARSSPGSPADTFVLMYDECGRTAALGPNEYVLVSLKTVEEEDGREKLENYALHLFADGTLAFFEDGALQPPGRAPLVEGQRGHVAFGPSPNCPFDHVTAEFEIELSVAGGHSYSPDPLFWSSTTPTKAPPPPPPPPPPPKPEPPKKTEQMRANLRGQARLLEAFAISVGANLGFRCAIAANPLCGAIVAAFVAALKLEVLLLQQLADDPPDPNFTVIAKPTPRSLSIQPVTTTSGLTQPEADALNAAFTNSERTIAVTESLITSIERAQGAFDAGNDDWVIRQALAARQYGGDLAALLDEKAGLLAGLKRAAEAAGFQSAIAAADVQHFQAAFAQALPSEIANPLIELGANGATREQIRRSIVADDPAEVAALGGGQFPQLLADASVVTGLQAAVGPLTAFANVAGSGMANGGFETSNLDAWDVARGSVANVVGSLGPPGSFTPILPAAGERMAFLSTAGTAPAPPGTLGSVMSQTFVVPPSTSTLDFCYQFVSNDSAGFENFFLAQLETQSGTFTLASADNAAGSPAGGFRPPPPPTVSTGVTLSPDRAPAFLSGVNILGSGLFGIPSSLMTRRVCSSFVVPPEVRATAVTLRFSVGDVADVRFDSAVVIDSITPESSPDSDRDGVADDLDNCPAVANPAQRDDNLDGVGATCEPPSFARSTAAVLQARSDGSTAVEPTGLLLTQEPSLLDQLVRIVEFRLAAGLTTSPRTLTQNLADSLIEVGLVGPGAAQDLVSDVLEQIDSTPPVVDVSFPPANGQNGWFVTAPVVGQVSADDTASGGSAVTDLTCTGAQLGAVSGLGTPHATATVTVAGDGVHAIQCAAKDAAGNEGAGPGSSDRATVQIDTTAPTLSCSVQPETLWPPNHKLATVTNSVVVDDAVSGPDHFSLRSAVSSEPDDGLGDGDTPSDLQGWLPGTPDLAGEARAERSGAGPGRTYTFSYEGQDAGGNSATCVLQVAVPHDRRK